MISFRIRCDSNPKFPIDLNHQALFRVRLILCRLSPEAVPPPMVSLSNMATTSTPTDCSVEGWLFTESRIESAVTVTSAWYHLLWELDDKIICSLNADPSCYSRAFVTLSLTCIASFYFAMSYDMLRELFYNLMGHFVYNISISPLTMTLNEAHQFTHHLWSVPPSTQAFPGAVGVYALIVALCSLWMSSAVTCVSK